MPPSLGCRLEAVLACIPPCALLADVGTDHGLLPLAALVSGKAERAIGIDRNRGPLERAAANRQAASLMDRLELKCGDGLAPLGAEQPEVVTICGLGGRQIERILRRGGERLAGVRRLVLQPNQNPEVLRAWAREAGWHLVAEKVLAVVDEHFPILVFEPGAGPDPAYGVPDFSDTELLLIGPRLLAEATPEARAYVARRLAHLEDAPEAQIAPWWRAIMHLSHR